jgi:hypothetical protein
MIRRLWIGLINCDDEMVRIYIVVVASDRYCMPLLTLCCSSHSRHTLIPVKICVCDLLRFVVSVCGSKSRNTFPKVYVWMLRVNVSKVWSDFLPYEPDRGNSRVREKLMRCLSRKKRRLSLYCMLCCMAAWWRGVDDQGLVVQHSNINLYFLFLYIYSR